MNRVSHARVKRIVEMTDPHAAAQMALRRLPGALACLSATGGDNATSMNDEEMRTCCEIWLALIHKAPRPDQTGRRLRAPTAGPRRWSTRGTA